MSLIKKIDVPRHFAARRASRRTGILFARQALATGVAESKAVGIETNGGGFAEDFSLERSSSSAPLTPSE